MSHEAMLENHVKVAKLLLTRALVIAKHMRALNEVESEVLLNLLLDNDVREYMTYATRSLEAGNGWPEVK